ncbi:CBS domain-containing protein [Kordiimonas aquimaris]|uniref:CBS domain-containing protein n=1 Tax=Kordiimonas aquimaris TaxID=707591 RepID=UPI0021D2FF26|nr:CBS domain-containing protein [Kordiimonas aquimaris]
MNVGKILEAKESEIISLEETVSVLDVAKLLGERRIGAIPIMKKGKLCGIISERDVVRGLAIRGGDVLKDSVKTLMTKAVVTCSTDQSVGQIMTMMTERRIRHVPVVEKGELLGMISIGDVVKERMEETQQEAEALKAYIATA